MYHIQLQLSGNCTKLFFNDHLCRKNRHLAKVNISHVRDVDYLPSKCPVFRLSMERNNRHSINPAVASSEATTPSRINNEQALKLHWFPLRIYYPGPKKILWVKAFFDQQGINNFVPMQWVIRNNEKGNPSRRLVPAITNLIIIQAYEGQLTELKEKYTDELHNVEYRRDQLHNGKWSAPITVPDREMNRFMGVVTDNEDSLTYIDPEVLEGKKGRNVRVVAGQFKGAEGMLLRIDNNRHVVVQLHGLCSVKLNHIPIVNIRFTDSQPAIVNVVQPV